MKYMYIYICETKYTVKVLSTVLYENVLLTFKHNIEIWTGYNKKESNSRFTQHLNEGMQ